MTWMFRLSASAIAIPMGLATLQAPATASAATRARSERCDVQTGTSLYAFNRKEGHLREIRDEIVDGCLIFATGESDLTGWFTYKGGYYRYHSSSKGRPGEVHTTFRRLRNGYYLPVREIDHAVPLAPDERRGLTLASEATGTDLTFSLSNLGTTDARFVTVALEYDERQVEVDEARLSEEHPILGRYACGHIALAGDRADGVHERVIICKVAKVAKPDRTVTYNLPIKRLDSAQTPLAWSIVYMRGDRPLRRLNGESFDLPATGVTG